MTSPSLFRVLLARWYLTVAGLLLSLVLLALAFTLVPAQNSSSGTAVLVQPKQIGSSSANPLLAFGSSLNTTALIIVQGLNTPQVALDLGLTPGEDSFTAKNEGSSTVNSDSQQPFISVTAQSRHPGRSANIVTWVMNRAQQDLADRQTSMRVATRNDLRLASIVDPTPPKPVRDTQLRVLGAVLVLGLALTVTVVCAYDRALTRRAQRCGTPDFLGSEDTGSSLVDVGAPPSVAATSRLSEGADRPTTTAFTPPSSSASEQPSENGWPAAVVLGGVGKKLGPSSSGSS
jgi:capsular polysaccharide biosynthesis protein